MEIIEIGCWYHKHNRSTNLLMARQMARANRGRRRRGGRPSAGVRDGEKVGNYPQLSVRVPAEMKLALGALSVIQSKPQWRIVLESLECHIRSLSEPDQRRLQELVKRPCNVVPRILGADDSRKQA